MYPDTYELTSSDAVTTSLWTTLEVGTPCSQDINAPLVVQGGAVTLEQTPVPGAQKVFLIRQSPAGFIHENMEIARLYDKGSILTNSKATA